MSTWEWEYHRNPLRWTLTVGDWSALVQRVEGSDNLWHASIVQTTEPHDHYDGPTSEDTIGMRAWCLQKIAELGSQPTKPSEAPAASQVMERGAGQPTNWQYKSHAQRWEVTSGDWRAVVVRLSDTADWYPYVERIHPPHDRRDGPTCAWTMEGRAWCEAEIKRLQVYGKGNRR